ncbi:ATP-binding protein [Candidatus Phytoplasma citri]
MDDLFGMKEEKLAAQKVLDFVTNAKMFEGKGKIDPPKGMLLYGVLGTGKTFFANCFMKDTHFKYVAYVAKCTGADFAQKYVGESVKAVHSLFDSARKIADEHGVAIIFVDECEEVFVDLTQIREHHKGQSEAVTAFKEELTSEKNNPTKPIFLIAATNYLDKMDDAIKSRFTYKIEVKPSKKNHAKTL